MPKKNATSSSFLLFIISRSMHIRIKSATWISSSKSVVPPRSGHLTPEKCPETSICDLAQRRHGAQRSEYKPPWSEADSQSCKTLINLRSRKAVVVHKPWTAGILLPHNSIQMPNQLSPAKITSLPRILLHLINGETTPLRPKPHQITPPISVQWK